MKCHFVYCLREREVLEGALDRKDDDLRVRRQAHFSDELMTLIRGENRCLTFTYLAITMHVKY